MTYHVKVLYINDVFLSLIYIRSQ